MNNLKNLANAKKIENFSKQSVEDLCWNLFLATGQINYYLLRKELLELDKTFVKENVSNEYSL